MVTRKKTDSKAKPRKPKKSKTVKWLVIIFLLFAAYVIFFYTNDYIVNKSKYSLERVENNYGKEVDSLCAIMDLPPSYIKALIMLECSGYRPPNPRFEEHVFSRLQQVRDGKRKRLEGLKTRTLRGYSDAALVNLAKSWGPFQIMGYKSVQLKVKVYDLRGENAVYWGLKWIDKEYGKLLRKKRYKDAFHFHNTGKHFPDDGEAHTFDPQYVTRGLKYIEYFDKIKDNKTDEN